METRLLIDGWVASLAALACGLPIRLMILLAFRWGTLKQCAHAALYMYSASLLFPTLLSALDVPSAGIRVLPGTIIYFQSLLFFLWIPAAVVIEGYVLELLRGETLEKLADQEDSRWGGLTGLFVDVGRRIRFKHWAIAGSAVVADFFLRFPLAELMVPSQ